MTEFDEFFYMLGIVFPNRIRVLLDDRKLGGIAGNFSFEVLHEIGTLIEEYCPEHSDFADLADINDNFTTIQKLIDCARHSGIVVRYVHSPHCVNDHCRTLAIASGPAQVLDQLDANAIQLMPITSKEMTLVLDLAAGNSLQCISEQREISIHTIRNQIKSAMRSTGTHSQAQLVALIRDWLL